MKKRTMHILLIVSLVTIAAWYLGPSITGLIVDDNRPTIRIATWNIENFGAKKASDAILMQKIGNILDDYDIVAIQEISNVDERADLNCPRNADACPGKKCNAIKNALLEQLQEKNYSVVISNQVKDERYMFVFNHQKIALHDAALIDDPTESTPSCDLHQKNTGLMLRQPYRGTFSAGNLSFALLNAHTSPSQNLNELDGLFEFFKNAVQEESTAILLGDLNADCAYLQYNDAILLRQYFWIIPDSADTTVSKSNCAYDRIIIPYDLKSRFAGKSGVDSRITDDMSDHYLVWAEFYIN